MSVCVNPKLSIQRLKQPLNCSGGWRLPKRAKPSSSRPLPLRALFSSPPALRSYSSELNPLSSQIPGHGRHQLQVRDPADRRVPAGPRLHQGRPPGNFPFFYFSRFLSIFSCGIAAFYSKDLTFSLSRPHGAFSSRTSCSRTRRRWRGRCGWSSAAAGGPSCS
jgi:hypothetical protein